MMNPKPFWREIGTLGYEFFNGGRGDMRGFDFEFIIIDAGFHSRVVIDMGSRCVQADWKLKNKNNRADLYNYFWTIEPTPAEEMRLRLVFG